MIFNMTIWSPVDTSSFLVTQVFAILWWYLYHHGLDSGLCLLLKCSKVYFGTYIIREHIKSVRYHHFIDLTLSIVSGFAPFTQRKFQVFKTQCIKRVSIQRGILYLISINQWELSLEFEFSYSKQWHSGGSWGTKRKEPYIVRNLDSLLRKHYGLNTA